MSTKKEIVEAVGKLTDAGDLKAVIAAAGDRLDAVEHAGPAGPMTKAAAGWQPHEEVATKKPAVG